ncbi:MAG: polysaccharide deacetylase family protein [Rhodospirillales bacterium]|nr:polysaccharide deacetylase family protein [Rhodospirillales bacterium]
MSDWADLMRELDAWHEGGRCATFWWRDDDATRVTLELEHLLDIAAAKATPVALAVIPSGADDGLRRHLASRRLASVLQHGWSHANHAPDGVRQEEFGLHRPLAIMLDEIVRGWRHITTFARALPIFVAPWNRMEAHLLSHLGACGLKAVSTLGPRPVAVAANSLRQTNVHVDIIDWQGTRGFFGLAPVLDQVISHLRARREGRVDAGEPTGLMTHHGFHDAGCWTFIEAILDHTRAHPAARWLSAEEAFFG